MEEEEPCEENMAKSRAAKYGRRSRVNIRGRIRRMPYGEGIVKVGVWEEMESCIDLIHERLVEIVHLAHRRDGGAGRSDHSGSLGELNINHRRSWRHDLVRRGVHLSPISRW
ncbi:hypothetical protein Acr_11g0007680 [Actinidia rufa]|uniref:Uncharacterized protein n=1 Tax=Actinidia rufa TaxID=165716 RepID=A0A7J0FCP6_9ERIC|nr:hypothetical protein Acr_11g0007680 [Actinidia rufa]